MSSIIILQDSVFLVSTMYTWDTYFAIYVMYECHVNVIMLSYVLINLDLGPNEHPDNC